MKYYVGIDLGGTNIAVGVVDECYHIVGRGKLKTAPPRAAELVADDMATAAGMALQDAGVDISQVEWVGIGTPGTVNQETQEIEYSNNLQFHHVPMIRLIEERLGKMAYMENDANAAVYGEALAGAAKGHRNVIGITLGTGVGGGVIIDGKIYSGFNFAGAELGHTVIVYDGKLCTCGRKGCFEAYSSASGLIGITKDYLIKHPDSEILKMLEGDITKVNGRTAFQAMRAGVEGGQEIVDTYVSYLGCGIVNMVNIFQPEILFLGGGISKEGEALLRPLREQVKREVFSKYAQKSTELCIAQLGNDAGIIGAAFLGNLYA